MTRECDVCESEIGLTEGATLAMSPLGPDAAVTQCTVTLCENHAVQIENVLEGVNDV